MRRNSKPGTYILTIALQREAYIRVGSLGVLRFASGFYCYVGSALGGLYARLARHLHREKRLHWHIDYLLQNGQVEEIWYHLGPDRHECTWAHALSKVPGIVPYMARFGASDCACRTHLFYSQSPPNVRAFQTRFADDTQIRTISAASFARLLQSHL
jgi:sugar fermentation stimulation protein A